MSGKRLLLAATLALAFTACSDDKSATTPTSPGIGSTSTNDTTTTLAREELAAMMPTLKEFRLRQWVDMQPAERVESRLENGRALRESVFWDLARADLDAVGRLTGYHRYFWNGGCGGTCLKALLKMAAEVHVFRDAQAASRFIKMRAEFYRTHDGKRLGVYRITSIELFRPGAIGEETIGFHEILKSREGFPGDTWRGTVVLFRVGPIVGVTEATSYNEPNPAARAVKVADVLETRIKDVLERVGS
jgi:hypothetical protein